MNTDLIKIACKTDGTTAARWLPTIAAVCALWSIDTPLRQAAFLAQVGYESGGLRNLEENLNYSAPGLLQHFGKYFTATSALEYEHKPIRIANRIYANRMGNGNEASGDGWKYRGRGLIQVTGHDNYLQVGRDLGLDCVANPDLLLQKETAAQSAASFWVTHDLHKLADKRDFDGITQVVNKYTDSYVQRKERFDAACKYLGV